MRQKIKKIFLYLIKSLFCFNDYIIQHFSFLLEENCSERKDFTFLKFILMSRKHGKHDHSKVSHELFFIEVGTILKKDLKIGYHFILRSHTIKFHRISLYYIDFYDSM